MRHNKRQRINSKELAINVKMPTILMIQKTKLLAKYVLYFQISKYIIKHQSSIAYQKNVDLILKCKIVEWSSRWTKYFLFITFLFFHIIRMIMSYQFPLSWIIIIFSFQFIYFETPCDVAFLLRRKLSIIHLRLMNKYFTKIGLVKSYKYVHPT